MRETVTLEVDGSNIDEVAHKAVSVLKAGGVILCPTDTVYGLSADAENQEAVQKIMTIKGRTDEKLLVLTKNPEKYAVIEPWAQKLMDTFWPGSLSIEFMKSDSAPASFFPTRNHIGLRYSNFSLCVAMLNQFENGIISTSANKAKVPQKESLDDIIESLGVEADLIDLVIDAGKLPRSLSSTVVGCVNGTITIFREGAISSDAIHQVLS